MLIQQIMAAFSMLSASVGGYEQCEQGSSNIFCGDIVVEQVISNGVASMQGTIVKREASINGTLYASDVKINKLTVNGTANIERARINEQTEINGTLDAKMSHFYGPIYLGSNTASFKNCRTKEIFIGHVNSPESKVYLSGTTIGGNITFLDKKGTAYICNGSKLIGKVINGDIIEDC